MYCHSLFCFPDASLQGQISTYVLRPLDEGEGDWVKFGEPKCEDLQHMYIDSGSSHFVSSPGAGEDPLGMMPESNRELRINLFMGEVVH